MNTPPSKKGPLPDLPGKLIDDLPEGFNQAALDLVLAWAHLDYALTAATLAAFDLPEIEGRVLLGAMDNRTKLERLKTLFGMTNPEMVADFGKIENNLAQHALPRNLICHSPVMGGLDSDPEAIVFGPYYAVIGHSGFTAKLVSVPHIKAATEWAKAMTADLYALEESLREEPPQSVDGDHPPNPRS